MQVFLDHTIFSWWRFKITAARGDSCSPNQNASAIKKCLLGGEIDDDLRFTICARLILPVLEGCMMRSPPSLGDTMTMNSDIGWQFRAASDENNRKQHRGESD